MVRLDGLKLAGLIIEHLDCPLAVQKIQVDVVRILKTTKQSKLRNQILKLLSKMLSANVGNEKGSELKTIQFYDAKLRDTFIVRNRVEAFAFQEIAQKVTYCQWSLFSGVPYPWKITTLVTVGVVSQKLAF